MKRYTGVFLFFLLSLFVFASVCAGAKTERYRAYIVMPRVNLRSQPSIEAGSLAILVQNQSVVVSGRRDGWCRVSLIDGKVGWVRGDLLSNNVLRVFVKARELRVSRSGMDVASFPVLPETDALIDGRYFSSRQGREYVISWPNRRDVRALLASGRISYAEYQQALLEGADKVVGPPPALCGGGGSACGFRLSPADFERLATIIPDGARFEVYADEAGFREAEEPDAFSRRIHQGAVEQLKDPAAGLAPGAAVPRLFYPGGDIQPDFASSSDIVIRAVRFAGLDLQAAIHEDMLLAPQAYSRLPMGEVEYGAHRHVPVMAAFLERHALSLPLDADENPFCFEPGDIVVLSTGADNLPDRVGVIDDEFDAAGFPLVITVWDMGQHTSRMPLIGKGDSRVIGHFRMTHLFDYQ